MEDGSVACSEAGRLCYYEWTGKSTIPRSEAIAGTEFEDVAVGEVEVGGTAGGVYGKVFHGLVVVGGEEGELFVEVVAEGSSDVGSPEEVLVIGVAGVVDAVDGFVVDK